MLPEFKVGQKWKDEKGITRTVIGVDTDEIEFSGPFCFHFASANRWRIVSPNNPGAFFYEELTLVEDKMTKPEFKVGQIWADPAWGTAHVVKMIEQHPLHKKITFDPSLKNDYGAVFSKGKTNDNLDIIKRLVHMGEVPAPPMEISIGATYKSKNNSSDRCRVVEITDTAVTFEWAPTTTVTTDDFRKKFEPVK